MGSRTARAGCGDATFKGDAIAMNQATPQAGGSLGSRHARTTNAAAHNGFIEAMVQGCRVNALKSADQGVQFAQKVTETFSAGFTFGSSACVVLLG